MRCFLLLGSNVGDRARRLKAALKALSRLPGCRFKRASRLYETEPLTAGERQRRYLNQAAWLRTSLKPLTLLIELKKLEGLAGRKPGRRFAPRPLDIDILGLGRRATQSRWLSIPHPRLAERAFALAPLADIAPRWKPDGRTTVEALLARLNHAPGSVRIFKHARR